MTSLLLCCAPALVAPLWIGVRLIGESPGGRDSFVLLAALFTLKSLLAMPLAMAIYISAGDAPSLLTIFFSLLPDVLLTTAIVKVFRPVFARTALRKMAWLLLVLDWQRWGSTLLAMLVIVDGSQFALVLLGVSLVMPTLYAIAAYRLTLHVLEHPTSAETR